MLNVTFKTRSSGNAVLELNKYNRNPITSVLYYFITSKN